MEREREMEALVEIVGQVVKHLQMIHFEKR